MVSEKERLRIEKIEKINEELSQNKSDIVMSSVFTGLSALLAAIGFLSTKAPHLFNAGMIVGPGSSLFPTTYFALLVKKIRDKSLLEKDLKKESGGKLR